MKGDGVISKMEKHIFLQKLQQFASKMPDLISSSGEWDIRGFIDVFKNIYTISSDTKVISKILELHLFPHFLTFAKSIDFKIELATPQNWYPDLTFIKKDNEKIKFAVDLKTTYRDEANEEFCNGFTLGSHGEYFTDRNSKKNIQYPYSEYSGHFCFGIIYTRTKNLLDETKKYTVEEIKKIPSVIKNFIFFAQEKWKIASDKSGSGNTANIGSIKKIDNIIHGNGVFANAGEKLFDDYWVNFGKIEVKGKNGNYKKLSSFEEFLEYRGLPKDLNNPSAKQQKSKFNNGGAK